MRGFYPDPRKVNTMKGERGWALRQAEALAKLNGTAEWRETNAARQAAYAEREKAALADVEVRRAADAKLRVTCPCCGAGALTVERAEVILAALDRAPENEERRLQAIRDKDRRPCPVCDSAEVNVELADRVVESLSRLPANRDVDFQRIGNLIAVGKGETYPGPDAIRVRNGATFPKRAAPAQDTVEAQTDDEALAQLQDTPARQFIAPPFLD